jgi:hypothetical protein
LKRIHWIALALLVLLTAASPSHAVLSCADYCTSCTANCYYWCYDDEHGIYSPCLAYIYSYGGLCYDIPDCQAAAASAEPVAACQANVPAADSHQDVQQTLRVGDTSEGGSVSPKPRETEQ